MSYALKSTYPTLPRTKRGEAIVLGGDPKGKNFLYANGNSIVIRDIANPSIADLYTEHSNQTTVAKYSPSGFYIASADITGKVRIWDTTQKEHVLKNEYQPLGGVIKDLAWSGDSQRIVVGGEGREKFGHIFMADTGTSVGEIMGQSKPLNSVDFRADRPFKIVTASEDNTLAMFSGPPFKFQFTIQDHTRFVNAVRYSPNGAFFVSGGAEGKAFLYDGTTGEKKAELGNPAHKMGIYGVCFSADSQQVLSVSGDKTAKIWDVATAQVVQEYVIGSGLDDMQVGCLWQGDYILTVSLSGHINYLDKNNVSHPIRVLKGHNKPITSCAVDRSKKTAYTGSSDGVICRWDLDSGEAEVIKGKGHSNQIQDLSLNDQQLASCGMDDLVMTSSTSDINGYQSQCKMASQPKGISISQNGTAFVACINEIVAVKDGKVVASQKVLYEPQCVAVSPDGIEVAFGGGDRDTKIHIYSFNGTTFADKKELVHSGALTNISYSSDGAFIAACDAFRKVQLFKRPDYAPVITTEWGYHTARVNSIDWTPDSHYVATGALDTHAIVWNPTSKTQYTIIKAAHPMSQVTGVRWIDNDTLLTVGQDSCLRRWSVKH